MKSRLSWVDDHASTIDSPQNDILAIGIDRSKTNWETLCLAGKVRAWYSLRNLRNRGWVTAASGWVCLRSGSRVCNSFSGVGPDGTADAVVYALAVGVGISAEPVV